MAGIVRGLALGLLLTAALTGCTAKREDAPVTAAQETLSPVTRYKELRASLHAAEKAQLSDVAHSASDAELARMAQEQLLEVCKRDEQELTCEAVLELRGFAEPVVTVHADSVNVILDGEALTQQQAAVILELICRETGADAENVKIIPINSN